MTSNLRLAWCSFEAAKFACKHWHYSGKPPRQKLAKVGVWESERFIGAVLFGDGANPGLFTPYRLKQTSGCELVRVALSTHQAPVSRIVSVALRLLKTHSPGLRLVLSFADPEQGHDGGIYRAGNWVHLGRTDPADEYIVNGRRMHGRALRSTRKDHRFQNIDVPNVFEWARRVIDPNITKVVGSSKIRFGYPLDHAMRKQLAPLAKPYPTRTQQGAEHTDPV